MPRPEIGNIYAVDAGDYMGEFFVLVEKTNELIFLSLPDFKIRHVPEDKYNSGLNEKILMFREKLPPEIFQECYDKYHELKA
jgi:hypothetical protein